MLDFLIDSIFVLFGGRVFQQTICIPMGTNCAPLLADLFLHAYEADVLQGLLKNKERKWAQTFNSSFRYIDYVLSLNNSRFGDYLHRIYPNELEVKDTTDTQKYASYLNLHLEIDNWGILKTKLYDKRDDITLPSPVAIFYDTHDDIASPSSVAIFYDKRDGITLPSSVAIFQHHEYGVYISQRIRYSKACALCSDFLDRAQLLTQRLIKQGYVAPRLKSSLQIFYGRHHNLVDHYEISTSQMTMDHLLFT